MMEDNKKIKYLQIVYFIGNENFLHVKTKK